uniref:Apple domain-containing protein n=1 Tax=Plectus sambesii TaxID=2011161 RepID=A0A914WKB4_9BILA
MPIARTPADSGLDCLSQCIDKQPKCKAAVYYQFFNGEKRICQLYAVNSASAGVEMAFDSPTQRTDVTILYEIPDNCAENDDNGALGTLEQLFRDVAGTNNGTLAVKNGESQPDDIAAINNSTSEAENGKLQPHDNATTNGTLEAKNQQPQPQGVAGTNNGSLESGDTELQQLQQVNNPEDENQRQLQLQQQQQQLLQQQLLQQQLQQQQQLQLQQLQQHQQTPCI